MGFTKLFARTHKLLSISNGAKERATWWRDLANFKSVRNDNTYQPWPRIMNCKYNRRSGFLRRRLKHSRRLVFVRNPIRKWESFAGGYPAFKKKKKKGGREGGIAHVFPLYFIKYIKAEKLHFYEPWIHFIQVLRKSEVIWEILWGQICFKWADPGKMMTVWQILL